MTKVGLYIRESSDGLHTWPLQMHTLRQYAEQQQWQVILAVEEVACGDGYRPARNQLLAAAKKRDIDIVLVWRLDRWGRSLTDLISTLTELGQLGVGFVSMSEPFDLTTATGQVMIELLGHFTQFKRDLLRERIKGGIIKARRQGRAHGRPKTAAIHKGKAQALFHGGLSKSKIAQQLKIGRTSVRRLLVDGQKETT